jgi:hypothetical protein
MSSYKKKKKHEHLQEEKNTSGREEMSSCTLYIRRES